MRQSMSKDEDLEGLAPKQYGRRAKKSDIQALNTRLCYDLIRLKINPATSIFMDLVSNYNLILHTTASIYLQRV